jgi:hypothetical protein
MPISAVKEPCKLASLAGINSRFGRGRTFHLNSLQFRIRIRISPLADTNIAVFLRCYLRGNYTFKLTSVESWPPLV